MGGSKFAKMGTEELEKGGVCWNVLESYQKQRPPFMEIGLLGWLMCFSKLQTSVIQDCGFSNYPSTTLSFSVNDQLPQTVKRAQKSQKSVPQLKE